MVVHLESSSSCCPVNCSILTMDCLNILPMILTQSRLVQCPQLSRMHMNGDFQNLSSDVCKSRQLFSNEDTKSSYIRSEGNVHANRCYLY